MESSKKSNGKTVKWIIKTSKKFIPGVILNSVIMIITAISAIYLALLSRDVLDIATKDKQGNLLLAGAWLFGLVAFQILINVAHSYLGVYLSVKAEMNYRDRFFKIISKRKYSGVSNYHSGDLVNRLTSDVETVDSGFLNIIPNIVSMFTKIVGGVWAIIVLEPKIAILILIFGLFVPALGRIISKHFKKMHVACQVSEGKTRSFMQECFENLVILKVLSGEGAFSKKLNSLMTDNFRFRIKKNTVSVISHMGINAFFTFGYYLVLLWGATSISDGAISYGTLMAFLQLFNQVRAPLQNVSGIMPQYYSMIASAERLIEIEDGEFDQKPDDKKVKKLKDKFKNLEFSNVCFAYKDEVILKNCNFTAERGKITAITGESGSGKSTVLKLILGLYDPQGGTITLDGETKIDTSLRELFTYVPQGNMVLSGTIRENISLCNDSITDSELIKASKAACIYDIIAELPEGFDTVLTERDGGLSEVQIQRISIARALLTDAPVLLLDEATSALDEATETQLLKNIKSMSDKTVLFITHRNTSLKACDKIIHVENKAFNVIKE